MPEAMSRREFVRIGAALGTGLLVAGAAGCAPATDETPPAQTPSSSYGGDADMTKRVLVGYATRTGSTVGVAEAIGESFGQRGFAVDVKPLRERPSLEGYDAVVLGSAVNGGAWLDEAVSFAETNRAALAKVPVAAFCVHIMNAGDDAKATKRRLAYLDKLRTVVSPTDEGYFLGKGPTAEDSSLIMRWAFRAFGGSGEGDCRDWEKIRAWAAQARI